MRHSRNDHPVYVGENFLEWFALFRRLRRKCRADRARLCIWRDAHFPDLFTVIGDPIGEFVKLFPKFRYWSVAERLSIFHSDWLPNNGGTTSVSST